MVLYSSFIIHPCFSPLRSNDLFDRAVVELLSLTVSQDRQICTPRPRRFAVNFGHRSRYLAHVIQVMHDPRRQQLPECDLAELRMHAPAAQILVR